MNQWQINIFISLISYESIASRILPVYPADAARGWQAPLAAGPAFRPAPCGVRPGRVFHPDNTRPVKIDSLPEDCPGILLNSSRAILVQAPNRQVEHPPF